MELACKTQNYHWGKSGKTNFVAKLTEANNNVKIDDSIHYAEFWMGTHPNGPSTIKSTNVHLSEFLTEHPEFIGQESFDEFGCKLPFLFKVLSVNTALSIQAHPSKSHAELLYRQASHIYKDDNHKPELAIALTNFQMLCGFRPVNEIIHFFNIVPELRNLVEESKIELMVSDPNKGLKNCFHDLMTASEKNITETITKLLYRLKNSTDEERKNQLAPLVERLAEQYPGDIGIVCVYWFNFIELNPGEAVFLSANEPHAYLHGECVECMANSDNVIRAGLTPKFRDVGTLCEMLTYKSYTPNEIKLKPFEEFVGSDLFIPPVKDFAVCKLSFDGENSFYNLCPRSSASILLVVQGHGTGKVKSNNQVDDINLSLGTVILIPARAWVSVTCSEALLMFQAFANFFDNDELEDHKNFFTKT